MRNIQLCVLLVYLTIFSSCNSLEKKGANVETFEKDIQRFNFSSVNPLYPKNQLLIFNKLGNRNDTSWSLAVFKINDTSVQVNLNELTPEIIAENFSLEKDSLRFSRFNGFRCVLPMSHWQELVKLTGIDSYRMKNPIRRRILDGTLYSLSYGSEIIIDSEEDFIFLQKVDSILTSYIVDNINYRASHPPSQYDKYQAR